MKEGAPLDFHNLKRKSTHHSNGKRDKEEEGKRFKEEIYRFLELCWPSNPHPPPLPSLLYYISLSPFSPFFYNNILIRKYVSVTTFKSD